MSIRPAPAYRPNAKVWRIPLEFIEEKYPESWGE
jgi:hypothetical protein